MLWGKFELAASGQTHAVRETERNPTIAKLHLDLGFQTGAVDDRGVADPAYQLEHP